MLTTLLRGQLFRRLWLMGLFLPCRRSTRSRILPTTIPKNPSKNSRIEFKILSTRTWVTSRGRSGPKFTRNTTSRVPSSTSSKSTRRKLQTSFSYQLTILSIITFSLLRINKRRKRPRRTNQMNCFNNISQPSHRPCPKNSNWSSKK